MRKRAVAPTIGVVLLVTVTVVIAAVVGSMALGFGVDEPAPQASITAEAKSTAADRARIDLTHVSGDTLDVRELTVRVYVDGKPLKYQPTVPSTGMEGFYGTPSGPFNGGGGRADTNWSAGEVAAFEIAGNNDPTPTSGDRVIVRIFADGQPVATATAIVQ